MGDEPKDKNIQARLGLSPTCLGNENDHSYENGRDGKTITIYPLGLVSYLPLREGLEGGTILGYYFYHSLVLMELINHGVSPKVLNL